MGTVHGLGVGVGFGGGIPWHPTALGSKLFAFYDSTLGLTMASAPALVDGNMEAAGIGAWTALRASAAKDASIYHAGTQSLRVYESGAGTPCYYQTICTVGERLYVTGWTRGDGVSAVAVGDWSLGTRFFSGTTAAAWEARTGEATVQSTQFTVNGAGVGSQVWLDDLTIANKSVNAWADQSGNGHHLIQGTATNKPYIKTVSGRNLVYLDGTSDCVYSSEAASTWNFLHDGTGMTVVQGWYSDAAAAVQDYLMDQRCLSSTTPALAIYQNVAAANMQWAVGSGIGGNWSFIKSGGTVPAGAPHVQSCRYSEAGSPQVTCRVDGADVYRGVRDGPVPDPAAAPQTLYLGCFAPASAHFLTGGLGRIIICNSYLTDAELVQAERWCAQSVGLVLP
jgi:hypothetical protein